MCEWVRASAHRSKWVCVRENDKEWRKWFKISHPIHRDTYITLYSSFTTEGWETRKESWPTSSQTPSIIFVILPLLGLHCNNLHLNSYVIIGRIPGKGWRIGVGRFQALPLHPPTYTHTHTHTHTHTCNLCMKSWYAYSNHYAYLNSNVAPFC